MSLPPQPPQYPQPNYQSIYQPATGLDYGRPCTMGATQKVLTLAAFLLVEVALTALAIAAFFGFFGFFDFSEVLSGIGTALATGTGQLVFWTSAAAGGGLYWLLVFGKPAFNTFGRQTGAAVMGNFVKYLVGYTVAALVVGNFGPGILVFFVVLIGFAHAVLSGALTGLIVGLIFKKYWRTHPAITATTNTGTGHPSQPHPQDVPNPYLQNVPNPYLPAQHPQSSQHTQPSQHTQSSQHPAPSQHPDDGPPSPPAEPRP